MIARTAEGRPKMKIAAHTDNTALLRSIPWSAKFLTAISTVDIIEVTAAKVRARKNTEMRINAPILPPGAAAKTDGSEMNVIDDDPPETTAIGSAAAAKIADMTVTPAMMLMLLLARPIVNAFRVVSSSRRI